MQNITNDMIKVNEVTIVDDMHGIMQRNMERLLRCAPTEEVEKKAWEKNPAGRYKAMNETANMEQKYVGNGRGNLAVGSSLQDFGVLSLPDKQKLLVKMTTEMVEIGDSMGYTDKDKIDVVPDDAGANRIKV